MSYHHRLSLFSLTCLCTKRQSFRTTNLLLQRGPLLSFFSSTNKPTTKERLQRVITAPNIISMGRIVATPLVGYFVMSEQTIPAISLLAICGATDFLDGWIARRFKQQSALGSVLDPLGDKLLIGTLTIALIISKQLPIWLGLLIIGRDIVLMLASFWVRFGMIRKNKTTKIYSSSSSPSPSHHHSSLWKRFFDPAIATVLVKPTFISKLNTALQLFLLGSTLCLPLLPELYYQQALFFHQCFLQYAVAGTTIASSISYLLNYRKTIKFIR